MSNMDPSNNRGRGRGRGNFRGRGRGINLDPYQESSVPTLGTMVPFMRQQQKSANNNNNKGNMPSTSQQKSAHTNEGNMPSTSKSSYKDVANNTAVNETAPEEKEYFENPITEVILQIEDEDIRMYPNNAWAIKSRYLESKAYPAPSGKGRTNMEILLTITESITISHSYDPSGSFISYSKCHINKIMSPKEWSLNPNGDKAIDLPEGKKILVNYWDYVEAFTKVFYYQNPRYKHSWFFTMNPNIIKSPIPNWVYDWWSKVGPSVEILPQNIKEQYDIWYDSTSVVQTDTLIIGQCPFLFFASFQIPWIWKWSLVVAKDKLNIPCLQRIFFYKWWKNMLLEDVNKMEAQIKVQIKEAQQKGSKEPFSANALKGYFERKYPSASQEEIMVKLLDHMKQQFFNTYPTQANTTADEDMRSQSSQGSQDRSNPYYCLAGEAQEENDPSSPTPEDVWDMMIHTMAQNAAKGKGKQN